MREGVSGSGEGAEHTLDDVGDEDEAWERERIWERQRGRLWRELSACVVRPAAVLAVLLLLLHGPGSALSVWPICYDYYVPDKIGEGQSPGCPVRSGAGEFIQGSTDGYSPCYHTGPWDVTAPPPYCRNSGCSSGRSENAACCCGASEGSARADPNLADGGDCSEDRWGRYAQTGASAGSCSDCKTGQGADNGIGGRVLETYGDPALVGISDPQTYGHVYNLDYKLASCSTAVRAHFEKMEALVNHACDVKTYFRLRSCGNCAQVSSAV